ncbi:MAG: branched-chain amino acid ABC transporter permease [bacterium]|nr:branched-chain amino acid ABC transporter permease [bacterium]MCP4966438.1 branched-chain amino acid ABC transporter permease [bacterium]
MTTLTPTPQSWLRRRRGLLAMVALLIAFPFLVSIIVDGQGLGAVIANDQGNARFLQGLAIEIFILAIYALSYDLILGVTGLLSFGHAMFFAVGAYTFGIMLKTHEMQWVAALVVVLIAAILQAFLFGVVLVRVKGIAFALVTLGLASVFWIVIQSSDLQQWAGAEIGLQGVRAPVWFLDTTNERFAFYLVTMTLMILCYVLYLRIIDSPSGKVFHAIRENEDRALMLGYNTFWFKLLVLVIASVTASLGGVLHTMHQPIVTPNIAGLGFTVTALLIILIGGVGTITGALVGAAVYRLLQFYLDRWFGAASELLIGLAYVVLVLYLPYGIVGTWRAKAAKRKEGWERLRTLLSPGERPTS